MDNLLYISLVLAIAIVILVVILTKNSRLKQFSIEFKAAKLQIKTSAMYDTERAESENADSSTHKIT